MIKFLVLFKLLLITMFSYKSNITKPIGGYTGLTDMECIVKGNKN